MDLGSAMYPGVSQLLRKESRTETSTNSTGALNSLGSTDANIFVCTNYISPQHFDKDVSLSVCIQLDKKCQDDEFHFSYTQWGLYIETIPNSIW